MWLLSLSFTSCTIISASLNIGAQDSPIYLISPKFINCSLYCQVIRVAIDDSGNLVKPITATDLNRHIARHLGIFLPVALMEMPVPFTEVKSHKVPLGLTLDRKDSPVLTVKLVPRTK